MIKVLLGITHLVCMQNFLKIYHFLPPDTHMYVCLTGGKKCFLENFAYVLHEKFLWYIVKVFVFYYLFVKIDRCFSFKSGNFFLYSVNNCFVCIPNIKHPDKEAVEKLLYYKKVTASFVKVHLIENSFKIIKIFC